MFQEKRGAQAAAAAEETEARRIYEEQRKAEETKGDGASSACASEGDQSLLDAEGEEEDDEARGDALRAGHHRLVVRQQRHGGAHAPDEEPAQVPVHAAAADAPCLGTSLPVAAPLRAWKLLRVVWTVDEMRGGWGRRRGAKAAKSTASVRW